MKLHKGSTVETNIDRKTRAAFRSLIQFGHRLAYGECEEGGQFGSTPRAGAVLAERPGLRRGLARA